MADFTDPGAARAYLNSLSAHPGRAGDTSNLNPNFAIQVANAIQAARGQGLKVGLESGFRTEGQTGKYYDAIGDSSHTYGIASDISGLDGPNGKLTNQWAQIAGNYGLHNPYGVGNSAEFNHWQLTPQPLEKTPELLASLKAARATGDVANVWKAEAAAPATVGTTINTPSVATNAASPSGGSFINALGQIESNNRNIFSGVDKDYPGQPGSRSQGYYQIDTPTWQQFAAKAGVDLSKYPTAMTAADGTPVPQSVQAQVAALIPVSRFGSRTQRMLQQQFGQFDTSKTVGQLSQQFGGATPPGIVDPSAQARGSTVNPALPDGATATAAAPPATGAAGAVANAFAPGGAAAPGGAVAKSLTDLDKALGGQQQGGQQQGGQRLDMQASPMIPGPGAANVSPLFNPMLGQQMMAQLSRPPAQPSTQQAPIGTTLNSMAMLDQGPVQFPQVYPSQMGYSGMGMSLSGYPSSGGYGYG